MEGVGTVLGAVISLAFLGGLFARLVALPYLNEQLIKPVLSKLETMHDKDVELEAMYRVAALMFEGHMTASETDRGRLWDAVDDLRRQGRKGP